MATNGHAHRGDNRTDCDQQDTGEEEEKELDMGLEAKVGWWSSDDGAKEEACFINAHRYTFCLFSFFLTGLAGVAGTHGRGLRAASSASHDDLWVFVCLQTKRTWSALLDATRGRRGG